MEKDKLLKHGYSLSLKALFPSSIERQNVKLALKIFNPFVIEALKGPFNNLPFSQDTADFITIIWTWWKIVNVKTPLKGKHLLDKYQEPFTKKILTAPNEDTKFYFLHKMLNWLDTWKISNFPNNLTRQTHTALSHTIYGLLEVIKYCLTELDMNYVLLGKFQTDPLEGHFGKYRQLAGGHYHISVRQLYESEKRLRIQSILSLKSRHYGNININKFFEPECDTLSESQLDTFLSYSDQINNLLSKLVIEDSDSEAIRSEMPVITYLGGYCCYIVLKKINCEVCKQNFTLNEPCIVEDSYNLIQSLSRGSLLYPREQIVDIVLVSYIIFKKVIDEFEDTFLDIYNKKSFLCQLLLNYLSKHKLLTPFEQCKNHIKIDISKIFLSSISNTFLKNYCSKNNDNRLSKKRKRKLQTFNK